MNNEIALDKLSNTDHHKALAVINWLNNCQTKNEFNQVLKEALLPLMESNGAFYGQLAKPPNNFQLIDSINLSPHCLHNMIDPVKTRIENNEVLQATVNISNLAHNFYEQPQPQAHQYCSVLSFQGDHSPTYQFFFCHHTNQPNKFGQRSTALLTTLKSTLLQTLKFVLYREKSLNYRKTMDLWSEYTDPIAVIREDGGMIFQSPVFEQIVAQQEQAFKSSTQALIKTIKHNQLNSGSYLLKLGKRLYEIKLTLISNDTSQQHSTYQISLSRVTHQIGRIFNQLNRKGLTHREIEIALMIYQGTPTREIAETIHLSYHTVRNHSKSIYRKLGVSSRGEMLVWIG